MAGVNRPAIIIAGIAGLCVSAAAGAGLGHYSASGISPIYSQSQAAPAYADETVAPDSSASDSGFTHAAARSVGGDDFADRSADDS